MKMIAELNGFVEIWGEVRLCHLGIIDYKNSKRLNIRITTEHHEVNTLEEFIEQVGGKLYESLNDYKSNKFVNLYEWAKKVKI